MAVMFFLAYWLLLAAAAGTPSPSPQPPPPAAAANCLPPLMGVSSCLPYLTYRSPAPPESCCQAYRSLLNSTNAVCICHLINGDRNLTRFTRGRSISQLRMVLFPITCNRTVPMELVIRCFTGTVPSLPIDIYNAERAGTGRLLWP